MKRKNPVNSVEFDRYDSTPTGLGGIVIIFPGFRFAGPGAIVIQSLRDYGIFLFK